MESICFMDYWGSPWIAHTILSFHEQNGEHIAFSLETRKQGSQTYSALLGFFSPVHAHFRGQQ